MPLRETLTIAAIALIVALSGVFTMPVVNRDEARYVQASTQMMESGDYLNIRFQDQARNKKPAGAYWLQAISVQAFSNPDNRAIWAYRLPSVLFAVLAALATYWGGRALVGERAAFAGALLLSVTILFGFESATAKTDATLLGLSTMAMAALARLRHRALGASGRLESLIFWIALGGSVLVKGPVGPALVVLTLLALYVWERQAKWMQPLLFWPGPVLFLLIFGPWLVAIQMATDGAFLQSSIGHDFLAKLGSGQESHGAPPGTYTAILPLFAFPLSFGLLPGIVASWQNRKQFARGHDVKFLLAWLVPFFVLLELVPTKLPHYPLPVYPALALLAGYAMQELSGHTLSRRISSVLALIAPMAIIAFVAMPNVLVPSMPHWQPGALVLTGTGLGCVLTLAAFWAVWRGQGFGRTLFLVIACGLVWQGLVRGLILPQSPLLALPEQISSALIKAHLHPRLSAGAQHPIQLVNYHPPSLVFDLGTKTVLTTARTAPGAVEAGVDTLVWSDYDCTRKLTPAYADFLRAMKKQDLCPATAPITGRGYNYSKGKCTTFHVLHLAACLANNADVPHS